MCVYEIDGREKSIARLGYLCHALFHIGSQPGVKVNMIGTNSPKHPKREIESERDCPDHSVPTGCLAGRCTLNDSIALFSLAAQCSNLNSESMQGKYISACVCVCVCVGVCVHAYMCVF